MLPFLRTWKQNEGIDAVDDLIKFCFRKQYFPFPKGKHCFFDVFFSERGDFGYNHITPHIRHSISKNKFNIVVFKNVVLLDHVKDI